MTETPIWEQDAAAEEQQRLVDDILIRLGRSSTPLRYQYQLNESRRYLVENLIEEGSISVIYGLPKRGKTFVAVSLALNLIKGKSWLGNEIKYASNVLYVAYEDPEFIKMRFQALNKACFGNHEIGSDQLNIISHPPDIFTNHFVAALEQYFYEKTIVETTHHVLIIDTLALAMAGIGDENNSGTMDQVIDYFRRIKAIGISIIFIHHSGKDPSKGLRGHNSLEAAIDNGFLIEKKPNISQVIVKQTHCRNGPADQRFILDLRTEFLKDESDIRDLGFSVPYLVFAEDRQADEEKPNSFKGPELVLLRSLQNLLNESPIDVQTLLELPNSTIAVTSTDLEEQCREAGISPNGKSKSAHKKAFIRAKDGLLEKQVIIERQGFIWPNIKPVTIGDKS